MRFKNGSGIYAIENIINHKKYIGSAIDLKNRKRQHFHNLKIGMHHNKHLQSSYNKYGKDNFIFYVLEYINDKSLLAKIEDKYIEQYDSSNNLYGYNKRKISTTNLGLKHSNESKNKISISKRGKPSWKRTSPMPEYQRIKLSNSLKGRSSWNSGLSLSEEHKKHLSENHADFNGKKSSNWGKKFKNSSSKYFGVYYNKKQKKWISLIQYCGKTTYLGSFIDEEDAAKAYNQKAIELCGDYANINIIGGENIWD